MNPHTHKVDTSNENPSWVFHLPGWCAETLTGIYLVASQWNPCDSTSVANGDSVFLILLGIAIGVFSCVDRLCNAQARSPSSYWRVLSAAFFAWVVICTLCVFGRGNARIGFLGLWQILGILGVGAAMFQMAFSGPKLVRLFSWLVGLGVGCSVYAFYQYAVSMPRTRLQFRENPFPILRALGIQDGTAEALQWKNRLESMEPSGPYALANSLAGFLAPMVVGLIGILLLFLACSPHSSRQLGVPRSPRSSILGTIRVGFMVLCLCLLAAVLLLTKSRTAWLATALFAGLLPVLLPELRRWLANNIGRFRWLIAAGCIVFAGVLGTFLWRDPQIVSEASKSLSYRLDYWQGALQITKNSPWIGYGPLQFQQLYATVKSDTASETPADPHNLWMEIAVTGGVPWLVIAATIVASLIFLEYQRQKRAIVSSDSTREACCLSTIAGRSGIGVSIGAATALVGVLLISFFTADDDTLTSAILFGAACSSTVFAMLRSPLHAILIQNIAPLSFAMAGCLGVHFCFSGGWMQPGCMNVGMFCCAVLAAHTNDNRTPSHLHKLIEACSTAVWVICIALFGVLTCQRELRLEDWNLQLAIGGINLKTPESARESLEIHSWDPESARQIGELARNRSIDPRLGSSARGDWLRLYRYAKDAYVSRDPQHWQVHHQVAQWDASLGESDFLAAEERNVFLREARIASAKACELYPASIPVQLQGAVYAFWQNAFEDCEKYVRRVEEIDEKTPHLDRKVSASTVLLPKALEKAWREQDKQSPSISLPPSTPDGSTPGEPVFRWLRSQLEKRK